MSNNCRVLNKFSAYGTILYFSKSATFNLFNTTVYDEAKKIDVVIPNDMVGENELINFTKIA